MAVPTIGELRDWAGNDYQRLIALAVATNGRDVYNFLKQNNLLGANWTKGYEQVESSRRMMADLLVKAAVKSGNPLQYVKVMISALPSPDIKGNQKALQNVTRLLRNNP